MVSSLIKNSLYIYLSYDKINHFMGRNNNIIIFYHHYLTSNLGNFRKENDS